MDWSRWRRRAEKLRNHPRPLRFAASRVLWHSGLSHFFIAELGDGLRVRFFPSSISAALWVEKDARNEDAEFLELVLRAGDTYVDCGANIGHLALVARRRVGETGAVTAIEANPRIFRYCAENLKLNHFTDVRALHLALGETHGEITISDHRADDQNRVGAGSTAVPMRPLDEVLDDSAVTLLKLDVEGFEVAVLRGAPRTLGSTSLVYCELSASNSARFGFRPAEAERLLVDAGFLLVQRTATEWTLSERGVFETLSAADHPRTGYNLVAVRRTFVPELTARLAARGVRVS